MHYIHYIITEAELIELLRPALELKRAQQAYYYYAATITNYTITMLYYYDYYTNSDSTVAVE